MKLTVTMIDGLKFIVEGGPYHIGGFAAIARDCPRVAIIDAESEDGTHRIMNLRPVTGLEEEAK